MFLQNAKLGKNGFGHYLLTLFLIVLALIAISIPIGVAIVLLGGNAGGTSMTDLGLDPNLSLALNLIPFVFCLLVFVGLINWIHKRSFKSVLTGREKLDWSRIIFGGLLWLLVMGGFELVFYFMSPENYSLNFNWQLFLPLLVISLLMLPLQTTFEEVIFRGYLMQGFASIGVFRWVPLLLTSVLFGALHLANPEAQAFGMVTMSAYYISVGLVLGICTLMDDGMELALGLHAANNLFGALVLSFDDSVLNTPSIFKTEIINPELMLLGSLIGSTIYLFILSKKYNWKSFSSLFSRIEEVELVMEKPDIDGILDSDSFRKDS